jgi:valyl-tRNA synthetase
MSKSRGTAVDPLEAVDQYGSDALRFALLSGTSPGNDQRLSDERMEAGRNFANKLWNASRFALGMVEPGDSLELPDPATMPVEDRWVLSRLNRLTENVDRLLGRFELAEALRQTRDFCWDELADWYIEVAKVRVRAGDRSPLPVLVHVLDRSLRLLHPFMPFVTEEIWQRLAAISPDPEGAEALIVARFPSPNPALIDDDAERQFEAVQGFVRAIRNIRAEKRVDAGRWVEAYVVGAHATTTAEQLGPAIEQLARVRPLHVVPTTDAAPTDGVVTSVLAVGQVALPMAGLFDLDAERERLARQVDEVERDLKALEGKLANEQFTSRAPADVVQRERDRLETARARLEGLRQSIAELG